MPCAYVVVLKNDGAEGGRFPLLEDAMVGRYELMWTASFVPLVYGDRVRFLLQICGVRDPYSLGNCVT